MTHRQAMRYAFCTVGAAVYIGLDLLHGLGFNWFVFNAAVLLLIIFALWDCWHFDAPRT